MPFHDIYTVKAGDSLTRVAKRFGFQNPGPIYAYPENAALFRGRSPDVIRPGEKVFVPFQPDLLKKIVATAKHLATEVAKDATKFIKEEQTTKKQLEDFLFKVDAANFLANIGVGLAQLSAKGIKGVAMSSDEAIQWFVTSRISSAASVATFAIPAPTAPKKDFKFFVRHTLGPWNPSFWASVVVAGMEGDTDLYLYGPESTVYKNKLRIKQEADKNIATLKKKAAEARSQLSATYYRKRI